MRITRIAISAILFLGTACIPAAGNPDKAFPGKITSGSWYAIAVSPDYDPEKIALPDWPSSKQAQSQNTQSKPDDAGLAVSQQWIELKQPALPIFANRLLQEDHSMINTEGRADQSLSGERRRVLIWTRFTLSAEQLQRSRSEVQQRQGILFAGIGEKYKIFINKRKIHDALQADGSRWRRNLLVDLPPDMLAEENELVILLEGQAPFGVLDRQNIHFGLPVQGGFQIGNWHSLKAQIGEEFKIFLYSVFIFFGFYHFFLFLRRRDVYYNLFFAGFALSLALYFISFSNLIFDRALDTAPLIRMAYGAQALAATCFILFLHNLFFPDRRSGLSYQIAIVGNSLMLMAVLIVPVGFLRSVLYLWYPVLLYQLILVALLVMRALGAQLPDAKFILLSIIILAGTILWEIIDTLFLFTQIRLVHLGFFMLVLNLIALLANRFMRLQKETEELNADLHRQRNNLARFVPDGFLEALGASSGALSAGAHATVEMSVLSADLRRFHHYLKGRSAGEGFRLLNVCLQQMEQAVQFNGGFVDKIMGDGIMALFNETAVEQQKLDHPVHAADMAVQASLDMLIRLDHIGEKQMNLTQNIQAGIGIDSGEVILGAVGGPRFLDTTVMGQSVEMAARLERLSGHFDVAFLITHNTYQRLADPDRYLLREIDALPVPGRAEALAIYEVMDHLPEDLRRSREAGLQSFAHCLALYREGEYEQALAAFLDLNERSLKDSVVEQYIERCHNMRRGVYKTDRGPTGDQA